MVHEKNNELIEEDKFILHREICNYFSLCLEICKSLLGK
jgi:hypothetical protein